MTFYRVSRTHAHTQETQRTKTDGDEETTGVSHDSLRTLLVSALATGPVGAGDGVANNIVGNYAGVYRTMETVDGFSGFDILKAFTP